MTTKRKTTLLTMIIFGALAFVPFMSGPHGPIPVWEAYVILPLSVQAGYWADFGLASGIILVIHVGLSVGLAALISQILARGLQPCAASNGGPAAAPRKIGNH